VFLLQLELHLKSQLFDIRNTYVAEYGLLGVKRSRGGDEADDMLSYTESEILWHQLTIRKLKEYRT
jgi:hypothetical protein